MEGDLYGAERICIRKSARVCGNISSPRVSLEDGANFKGSIEMDPEAEVLKMAFSGNQPAKRNEALSSRSITNPNSGKQTIPPSPDGSASGKFGEIAGKERSS